MIPREKREWYRRTHGNPEKVEFRLVRFTQDFVKDGREIKLGTVLPPVMRTHSALRKPLHRE